MKIFKKILVLVSLIFITLSLAACDKKDNKPEVKPEVTLTSVTLDQDNINTNRLNLSNTVKPLSVQLDYLLVKKSENVIRLTINLENPKQHTILSLKIKDSKGASKLLDSSDRDELGNLVESNTFNWASRSNLKSEFLIELDVNSTPNDIEILEILYIDAESNQTIRADLNNKNVSRVYIYDAEIEINTPEKTLIGTRFDYSVLGEDIDRNSVEFFIKKGNSAPIKINNVTSTSAYANIFDNEELDEISYYNLFVKYNMTGDLPESEKTVERLLISDFQLVENGKMDIRVGFNKNFVAFVLSKAMGIDRSSLSEYAHFKVFLEINNEEKLLIETKISTHNAGAFPGSHLMYDFNKILLDEFESFEHLFDTIYDLDTDNYKIRLEIVNEYNGKQKPFFNGYLEIPEYGKHMNDIEFSPIA